jgi:uncharacterized protein
VQVTVLEVDISRKRISLSMKDNAAEPRSQKPRDKKQSEEPEESMEQKLNKLKGMFK